MSWRETLWVIPYVRTDDTHYSHNAQKPSDVGICVNFADSAHRESIKEHRCKRGSSCSFRSEHSLLI